ncbi:hypothetical protein EC2788150_5425 [Escherichia coli 2788150]|nr:hypothetical protein EC2788150_5425 [Escherichia coli 2788150]
MLTHPATAWGTSGAADVDKWALYVIGQMRPVVPEALGHGAAHHL